MNDIAWILFAGFVITDMVFGFWFEMKVMKILQSHISRIEDLEDRVAGAERCLEEFDRQEPLRAVPIKRASEVE